MKRRVFLGAFLALAAGSSFAAVKYEDKELGIALEAPEGFIPLKELPRLHEALGATKAAYADPRKPGSGGLVMIHHMSLLEGGDYPTFKQRLPEAVGEFLGAGYRLLKQEDVTADKLAGFMIEFEAPGDGKLPQPGGPQRQHMRWYLFREGADRLVGVIYHATEEAWKELEPKFAASYKTVRKPG